MLLAIPMQMGFPPRLTVDDVNLYPAANVLTLDSVTYSEQGIDACVRKFARLAELLPHTPINGVGINFRYWGDLHDSDALAELFTFGDAGRIDAGSFNIVSSAVKRTFTLKDMTQLNLTLESLPGQTRIEFNFHADVRALEEAAQKVVIDRVRALRKQAEEFLQTVYAIELDN